MSMFDALRKIPDWLRPVTNEPSVQLPEPESVAEDIAEIVQLARWKGQIDRQSATWLAVSAWAANELLETFVKMESADDDKTVALRARARTLRDLLAMDNKPQKPVTMESTAPFIP